MAHDIDLTRLFSLDAEPHDYVKCMVHAILAQISMARIAPEHRELFRVNPNLFAELAQPLEFPR